MNTKQFLLYECENVRNTLRDVLRHEYIVGTSEAFYKEFNDRLNSLRGMLEPVDLNDLPFLRTISRELSLLSTLVHQIERSRAGEFSWSFQEGLHSLAIPLCKEPVPLEESEPIIRVYAEGGLDSYKINLESDLSALNIGRRVFTIVFPRTLKHHVLLHTIFGHEIGHAAYTIPSHRAKLLKNILGKLQGKGPLTSTSSATDWLRNDPNAPAPIKEIRKQYPDPYYTQVDAYQWDFWFQEFMCDLFGMVTFGPSFLAAHRTLLLALDPAGYDWGPQHPPYACRRAMLWRASKHLGWENYSNKLKDKKLQTRVGRFLDTYRGISAPGQWEDVFTQDQVSGAVDALIEMLSNASCRPYAMPDSQTLLQLVDMLFDRIPPCGSDLSGGEVPNNRTVDFRHILFAGWIAWANIDSLVHEDHPQMDFLQINKLCEMGILHQRAIDLYDERKKERKA